MKKRFEYNGEAIEVESRNFDYLWFAEVKRAIYATTKLYPVEDEGKTYLVPRYFAFYNGQWFEVTRHRSYGYVLGSNLDA